MTIVAVVDPEASGGRFVGAPLVASWEGIVEPFDAVVVTDLTSTRRTCEAVLTRFGLERVLVPALLRQRLRDREEQSS